LIASPPFAKTLDTIDQQRCEAIANIDTKENSPFFDSVCRQGSGSDVERPHDGATVRTVQVLIAKRAERCAHKFEETDPSKAPRSALAFACCERTQHEQHQRVSHPRANSDTYLA
jgi:hypothetical protein